jgi:mannose-6-phosphate isomerase-like protein (cupin superfamily)
MPVIYASKAKTYEMPGVKFTGLAAPQTGSKENSAWQFSLAPKSNGTLHQLTREEIMIVIRGSAVAEIGTERHEISAGDAIIIPAFTDFKISNKSEKQFDGVAMIPIGAQAVIGTEPPFTPPWTL